MSGTARRRVYGWAARGGAQVWDERSQAQVIEVQRFRPYAKQSAVQLLEEMMRVRQVRLLSVCPGFVTAHQRLLTRQTPAAADTCKTCNSCTEPRNPLKLAVTSVQWYLTIHASSALQQHQQLLASPCLACVA